MLTLSEIPGLYGTFKMEEVILQWIWAEQAFVQENLSSVCGKKIEVVSCGQWNKSGKGPDFKNAQIRLDGMIVGGDIEVHFRGKDWQYHGHDQDRNFNRVVLHVPCSLSKEIYRLPIPQKVEPCQLSTSYTFCIRELRSMLRNGP